jgi:Bacterial protein of unknown function (DUF899)
MTSPPLPPPPPPEIVSREEWLKARLELLAEEKALTRRRDVLNARRRRLPMVRVEKKYVFDGPNGEITLPELFDGHRQLVVQHVMFGPDWDSACPRCTAATSGYTRTLLDELHERDTAFVMICRAPIVKVEAYTWGRGLPHLLDVRAGHGPHRPVLCILGPDRARQTGGVGAHPRGARLNPDSSPSPRPPLLSPLPTPPTPRERTPS